MVVIESGPAQAVGACFDGSQQPMAPAACPRCQSLQFTKNGSFMLEDGTRQQRYRCKPCKKSFSTNTGTPLAYLKKRQTLQQFVNSTGGGIPLRRHSAELGIHLCTAFRWRHILLSIIGGQAKPRLSGPVAAGETYIPYSQKGRPRPKGFRWFSEGKPSCVLLMAGSREHRLAMAGAGRPSADSLQPCLEALLVPQAVVCATGAPSLATAWQRMARMRCDLVSQPQGAPIEIHPQVRLVGNMRAGLHGWLTRFRGVATRYLHRYLAWFGTLIQIRPAS